MRAIVVGAGLSGATVARKLAEAGWRIDVLEKLMVAGGHCRTHEDTETGIMVHDCGPHIFHTDSTEVWEFVNRFADFRPFVLTVRARVRDEVLPLPINLQTINQFFRKAFSPQEAHIFLDSKRVKLTAPAQNFEEQALSLVGQEIYEAFFKGYTTKQWGRLPTEIPAAVLKRLPFRLDYNQNYFSHPYQGIPKEGYSQLTSNILAHENIAVHYGETFSSRDALGQKSHIVFTGPLDEWFDYSFGRLPYRTLRFENFIVDGDFQGAPIINYCDSQIPYTRVVEHKHFTPWQQFDKSYCTREYSSEAKPGDEPFYPVNLSSEQSDLRQYFDAARQARGVSFVGRMATFRYIDMDVAIAEAIKASKEILQAVNQGKPVPPLF